MQAEHSTKRRLRERDMPLPTETKKFIENYWATNGATETPENAGIERVEGFDVRYEQAGSGVQPERTVFNNLFGSLQEAIGDAVLRGILPWDSRIDYLASDDTGYSFVVGSDLNVYVALKQSGPSFGNPTDPTSDGQDVWRLY